MTVYFLNRRPLRGRITKNKYAPLLISNAFLVQKRIVFYKIVAAKTKQYPSKKY
jgi:hypothetical protein